MALLGDFTPQSRVVSIVAGAAFFALTAVLLRRLTGLAIRPFVTAAVVFAVVALALGAVGVD